MNNIRFKWLTLILLLSSTTNYACSYPAQGTLWTHEQLINKTETIVLATLIKDSNSRFKVVEILKGKPKSEFSWIRVKSNNEHKSIDFNGHSDKSFWKGMGDGAWLIRSNWIGGACNAQFTFIQEEMYLIFVESRGHIHSAEIIKSNNDKWYKHVKSKITHKN